MKIKLVLSSIAVLAAMGTAFTSHAFKGTVAYQHVAVERYTNTGAWSCVKVGQCNIGSPNAACHVAPSVPIVLYTVTTTHTCGVIATGTYTVTF